MPDLRRRQFITLLGAAAAWPLAARAQEPGRVYRLGAMIPAGRQTPAVIAFFDEMRLFGFIENQNLIVLPNGFGVRNDELVERAEALIKAAPDVIISGPDNYTRVLQQLTHDSACRYDRGHAPGRASACRYDRGHAPGRACLFTLPAGQ